MPLERLLERVDRADIGLRRALLDHDADTDPPQIGAAAGDEFALGGKIVDRRRREHREVERFAAFDALGQCAHRVIFQDDLVAGLLLEIRHEHQEDLLEGTGRKHLDLCRRGAARRARGHEHHRNAQQRHSHLLLHDFRHSTATGERTSAPLFSRLGMANPTVLSAAGAVLPQSSRANSAAQWCNALFGAVCCARWRL